MKSLHRLIISTFIGPFIITFGVLIFIFVSHHVLKYSDEFVGKGLTLGTFAELMFYFSFNMVPRSLPLAIMLSSLMTFGNLGQHNELTAIKSAGISLPRILTPVFALVLLMSVGLFFFANYVLPKTNLEAYGLLYDMRHKKPALEFKEGMFYNGLPGYSIRIGTKHDDGQSIEDVVIYDHNEGRGNVAQIIADSGKMYTMNDDNLLVLELYNGQRNANSVDRFGNMTQGFSRSAFDHSKMIFDLSSFKMNRSDKSLFTKNRFMLDVKGATQIMDSMSTEIGAIRENFISRIRIYYKYGLVDSTGKYSSATDMEKLKPDSSLKPEIYRLAMNQAKSIGYMTQNKKDNIWNIRREIANIGIEKVHKYADAIACLIMFLIGAPIGAILKKGGMGIPTLLTILFFILFYVVTLNGEKSVKGFEMGLYFGTFLPNIILFPIGVFFLYQAYRDASLFEFDDVLGNLKSMFKKKGKK